MLSLTLNPHNPAGPMLLLWVGLYETIILCEVL
jgi:hypothetical protein